MTILDYYKVKKFSERSNTVAYLTQIRNKCGVFEGKCSNSSIARL